MLTLHANEFSQYDKGILYDLDWRYTILRESYIIHTFYDKMHGICI